jgi:hypothetical protein
MYFGTKSYLKSTRNHTVKHALNKYTNIKRGPTLYPTLSPLLFITKLHRYLSPPPLGPTLHPPLPPPMPMVALLYVTLVGSYGVCLFWWLGLSFVYETYKKKIFKKKQDFFYCILCIIKLYIISRLSKMFF